MSDKNRMFRKEIERPTSFRLNLPTSPLEFECREHSCSRMKKIKLEFNLGINSITTLYYGDIGGVNVDNCSKEELCIITDLPELVQCSYCNTVYGLTHSKIIYRRNSCPDGPETTEEQFGDKKALQSGKINPIFKLKTYGIPVKV